MKKVLLIMTMSILILLYDKVDALSITDNVQRSGSDYFAVTNPNDFIAYNDFYYTTVSSGWIDRIITYELSPKLTLGTHDYVEIPFITSYPSQTELNYPVQDDFVTCRTWTCDTYSQGVCGQFKCISWYTSGTSTTNDHMLTDYEVNGLSFYAKVIYADSQGNWSGWASCSIQGNSFVCPTEHDKYLSYIQVVINYNPPKSSQFYFGLQRGVNYYKGQQIQQAVEQNTQAINQQTQQQQQQHEELMNETQQYNDQTNTNINGANETIEYEQAESQLIESLDVNESIMQDIFINPQASAFIWNIADKLRNMNPSIIILMTSILGIGIFKLILNR